LKTLQVNLGTHLHGHIAHQELHLPRILKKTYA
jgi:hypothetical protein